MTTITDPFLNKKLNILVVDDEPYILDIFQEYLNSYPLYSVTIASSVEIAENHILEKGKRWHACLLDLGMASPDFDEFYLLKKYGIKIPFIIVSGAHSIAKGLKAKSLGAFEAIDKPFSIENLYLINIINSAVIGGIFLYDSKNGRNEIVDKAIQILFSSNVSSIAEWSFKSCISESNHRKIWNEIYGISPKKMFCIYRMLKIAFEFANKAFETAGKEPNNGISKFSNEIINLQKFYDENKQFVSQYFS